MICVFICICVGATTLFGSFKIYYNIDRIFELYRKVKYKSFRFIYMFLDICILVQKRVLQKNIIKYWNQTLANCLRGKFILIYEIAFRWGAINILHHYYYNLIMLITSDSTQSKQHGTYDLYLLKVCLVSFHCLLQMKSVNFLCYLCECECVDICMLRKSLHCNL